MSSTGNENIVHEDNDDEIENDTEIVLHEDEEFTGRTCSELDLDSQSRTREIGDEIHIVDSLAPPVGNIEGCEVENKELSPNTCWINKANSQEEQSDTIKDTGNLDPDVTFFEENVNDNLSQSHMTTSHQGSSHSKLNEEDTGNLNRTYSQDSTLPISQESTLPLSQESTLPISQEMESLPANTLSKQTFVMNKSIEETLEILPSRDVLNSPSTMDLLTYRRASNELLVQTNSTASAFEAGQSSSGKPTVSSEVQDSLSSLKKLSSSSSSYISSQCTTTSSSKPATESEDSEENIVASQDMFASQSSVLATQSNHLSVSQSMPVLQLSGDAQNSQGNDNYIPGRLCPSSPSSDIEYNSKGKTSTPLRPINQLPSDDIICVDESKLAEKRKHSDSSLESEGQVNVRLSKKRCIDNRKSVMVVGEFPKSPYAQRYQEDLTQDSQGFVLQLSQSGSQEAEASSSLEVDDNSWKSHVGRVSDAKSKDVKQPTAVSTIDHDCSIVELDEGEDEIQVVTPPVIKSVPLGEITLDSSGPSNVLSPSVEPDLEVLPPCNPLTASPNKTQNSAQDILECSPGHQRIKSGLKSSSFDKQVKFNHSTPQLLVTNNKQIIDLDGSKENIEPCEQHNIEEYEHDIIISYSFTLKFSCKTAVDKLKNEVKGNSITEISTIRSNAVRRDTSPSPLEENSSGLGGVSPGSTASGPGPFTLQPTHASRMALRLSTTSSSSAGSFINRQYRKTSNRQGRGAFGLTSEHEVESQPASQDGPASWKDLFLAKTSSHLQSELKSSGANIFTSACDEWMNSLFHDASSDETKTVVTSSEVTSSSMADNEEILGVPAVKRSKALLTKAQRERTDSTDPSTLSGEDKSSINENESKMPTSTVKGKKGQSAKKETLSASFSSSRKKNKRNATSKSKAVNGEQTCAPDDSAFSYSSNYFAPGVQVFALYENFYYPAELVSAVGSNQWQVIFHDSMKKVLNTKFFLLINTFEIGQSVKAIINKKGDYEPGTVTAVTPLEGQEDLYTITLASGSDVQVPKSDLCLSMDQAAPFLKELSLTLSSNSPTPSKSSSASVTADLDLDNCVHGKRNRTPKGNQGDLNSPCRPGPSNTSRRLLPADSSSSSALDDGPLATAMIYGVHSEKSDWSSIADPLSRKGKGVKGIASKKNFAEIEDKEVLQKYGPLPPNGSNIFSGYCFLITQADVIPGHRPSPKKDAPSSDIDSEAGEKSYSHASDSEWYPFTHMPLSRDRLSRQITQGGGEVLKHWSDIPIKKIAQTFVVTNRPCLTGIYIHCLAQRIKSVNHECIIQCCKENQNFNVVLTSNILPAGYSLLKRNWVEWRTLKSKSPLQNEIIIVVGDRHFKIFWEHILKLSGAKVTSVRVIKGLDGLTKILADNPCSNSILPNAQKKGIPIVSPVWVTQSLINNTSLPWNTHVSFSHDYNECD